MHKFISVLSILLLSFQISAQDSFKIIGKVFDDANEPLPFANVSLYLSDSLIRGTHSDLDGVFIFENIKPGEYAVKISSVGFSSHLISGVKVKNKDVNLNNIVLGSQDVLLKPIIYLYPKENTDISVKLNYNGELLYTYPEYPENGWNVNASKDGTLTDEKGMEYYGLFWEGVPFKQLSIGQEGFVVKGEETVAFLEEALATLGLTRREAMEFIIFWQPIMQNNPYNLIHFSTEEYEELAQLEINPKPETIIRVMMVFEPLAEPISIDPQDLSEMNKDRVGFTVVEWGGTQIKSTLSQH